MKLLVTGATGFLGGRLVERLLLLGWTVTTIGRNQTIGRQLQERGAQYLQIDLRDKTRIMEACAGQDAAFHCGALSSPWGKYSDFYGINVEGTRNIIAGCSKHGIQRLIHVSTPSVYFDFTDRLQIAEASPLPARFANAYAATKRLAELEIEQAILQGLQAVMIRPRAIFGPGDTSILPRLIKANTKRGIPMIDDGRAWIDLTYVDNVVDAMLLCLEAPAAALGRIYNISNGEPVQLNHILPRLFNKLNVPMRAKSIPYRTAYAIAAAMEVIAKLHRNGKEPMLTRYTVGILGRSQTLNISAARELLGYAPKISVDAGLDAFAADWREQ
jgi:nucleoside-diphosphate-sugar epimerase